MSEERFLELSENIRVAQQTNDLSEAIRLVQEARSLAAAEAAQMPEQREKEEATRILKNYRTSFGEIQQAVKMARKPRMRKIEQYLCDQCDKAIVQPTDGFVIQGNVYVANPNARGGLIGDNLPPLSVETFKREDIKETVLCKTCFFEALGLATEKQVRGWNSSPDISKQQSQAQDMASTLANALRRRR